jgi:hypothetical protein
MRVALILVFVSVLATPSEASKSCMSKTEARQQFGSVWLYWHGKDHCWDATPTHRYREIRKVQQNVDRPKWRDAMSKMLPDAEPMQAAAPVQTPWVNRWVDIEPRLPIVERGIDNSQLDPLPVIRKPEPMVTARVVVTVVVVITLMLAIVMIYEGPQSRNTRRVG